MSDFALLTEHWHKMGIPLVINEFMAYNSNPARDPQGEYDDWIEIYNAGAYPINVVGMYLTDKLSAPTKCRIPGDYWGATIIPPGGYLLTWADNDTADFGLHANFKLSADGEEITLFNINDSTLIDSIAFGEQTADGRLAMAYKE